MPDTSTPASPVAVAAKPTQSFGHAWVVCTIAALYFFYTFTQITKLQTIGVGAMADFQIGPPEFRALSSMYFWGGILLLFPAGLILDRFSTKRTLIIAMSISIICTFLFAFYQSTVLASWCLIISGMAGAFAFLAPLKLVSRWFPSEKLAFASGIVLAVGFAGAIVSQKPLAWLAQTIGWRYTSMWDALLGVVLLVLSALVIKESPAEQKTDLLPNTALAIAQHLWTVLKAAVTNHQNWLFGFFTSMLSLPMFVFGTKFGEPILQQTYGFVNTQLYTVIAMLLLGGMVGAPTFGWLSDKISNRKIPLYIGLLASLVLTLALMQSSGVSFHILYVIFFALGFFVSSQIIAYAIISESSPNNATATSLSIALVLLAASSAILVPTFAWLVGLHWNGTTVNNVPIFTASDYQFALWILPIGLIAALIVLAFGKETKCKKIA